MGGRFLMDLGESGSPFFAEAGWTLSPIFIDSLGLILTVPTREGSPQPDRPQRPASKPPTIRDLVARHLKLLMDKFISWSGLGATAVRFRMSAGTSCTGRDKPQ